MEKKQGKRREPNEIMTKDAAMLLGPSAKLSKAKVKVRRTS